jgi:phage terminase large subunit-like protein
MGAAAGSAAKAGVDVTAAFDVSILDDPELRAAVQARMRDRLRYKVWQNRRGGLRAKQRITAPFPSDLAIITGLGWGKGEAIIRHLVDRIDNYELMALLIAGPTFALTMSNMVRGNVLAPGLLYSWPPHMAPTLHLGDEPFMLAHTGCKIYIRAGHKPDLARGVNAQGIWLDEVDSWKPQEMTQLDALEVFDARARIEGTVAGAMEPFRLYSTTPKASRGSKVARELSKRPGMRLVRGSSYENTKLPKSYHEKVLKRLELTRRGREEVHGDILDHVIGALVDAEKDIDPARLTEVPRGTLERIVIGVDPSGGETGDEVGIVVAGIGGGEFPHAYVLGDFSDHYSAAGWGERVAKLAQYFDADVIGERNFGGDMVKATVLGAANSLGIRNVHVDLVTSSKGKHVRAAAVTPFYERHEVHHVGHFAKLEDQLCAFTNEGYDGDEHADRADALVFALREVLPIEEAGYSLLDWATDEEKAEIAKMREAA